MFKIPADECEPCGAFRDVYVNLVTLEAIGERDGFVDCALCPSCREKYANKEPEFMQKLKPLLRDKWEAKQAGQRIRKAYGWLWL